MKKETHTSKAIGKSHLLQLARERLTKLGWKESGGGKIMSKSTQEKKEAKPLPDGASPFDPKKVEAAEKIYGMDAKKKRIPDWDKEWHREKEKKLFDFDIKPREILPEEIDLSEVVGFGNAFEKCTSLSSLPEIDFWDGKSEP